VLTDANIIAGFTTPYSIQQMAQRLFDTSSMDLSVFHFSDPARLDFHLMEPCSIVGHSASDPIYEYRHPMDSVERFRKGPIDFGAFSSRPAFSVLRASDEDGRLLVSSGKIMLNATEDTPHLVSCYDVLGRLVAKEELRSGQSLRIGPGAYLYTIEWQDRVDRGMIVVP
jgi:hypothetical protein